MFIQVETAIECFNLNVEGYKK